MSGRNINIFRYAQKDNKLVDFYFLEVGLRHGPNQPLKKSIKK